VCVVTVQLGRRAGGFHPLRSHLSTSTLSTTTEPTAAPVRTPFQASLSRLQCSGMMAELPSPSFCHWFHVSATGKPWTAMSHRVHWPCTSTVTRRCMRRACTGYALAALHASWAAKGRGTRLAKQGLDCYSIVHLGPPRGHV
jgi:hypothetical protein